MKERPDAPRAEATRGHGALALLAAQCARSGWPGRPARAVVLGEANSGKTSLVNALAGAKALTADILSPTRLQTVLGYAARPSAAIETADRRRKALPVADLDGVVADGAARRLHVRLPLPGLKHLVVTDTPPLGCGDEDSDKATLAACRRADVVIWCTPAMQAWKASEERVWTGLPPHQRSKGVLAVTFRDAIASETDADRLARRLCAEAGALFQGIFFVTTA